LRRAGLKGRLGRQLPWGPRAKGAPKALKLGDPVLETQFIVISLVVLNYIAQVH